MKTGKKVYAAIELSKDKVPKIIGIYSTRENAEKAYSKAAAWINIVEYTLDK